MIQPIYVNISQTYVSPSGNTGVYSVTSTGQAVFTLPSGYFYKGTTLVYVNGVYQSITTDYTESSNRKYITFNTTIPYGWNVEIRYAPSTV